MGACLQAGQQGGRGAGPQERVAGEEVEHAESEGGECVRVFVGNRTTNYSNTERRWLLSSIRLPFPTPLVNEPIVDLL